MFGGLVFTTVLNQQKSYWATEDPQNGLKYIYDVNLVWITVLMALTLFSTTLCLSTDLKERRTPRETYEIFRTRNIFSGRIIKFFCRELSREDEDVEWLRHMECLLEKAEQGDIVLAPPPTVSADTTDTKQTQTLKTPLLHHN